MEWYTKVIKNYTNFHGTATRIEYWMFVLFNLIFTLALRIIDAAAHLHSVLSGIYAIALILPALAVAARRLHDTGKCGWWKLISLIPVIGTIRFYVSG